MGSSMGESLKTLAESGKSRFHPASKGFLRRAFADRLVELWDASNPGN
jgi:hypothetical protein